MRSFLILSFTIVSFFSRAQTELGIVLTPGLATFHTGRGIVNYNYLTTFSYGVRVNYHINSITFSSGFLHIMQGSKNTWELTAEDGQSEGTVDVSYHTKSLVIPLNLDYNIITKPRSRFFAGLGLYTGYLYSEYQDNTTLIENAIFPAVNEHLEEKSDHHMFNDLYLGINVGVGWQQYFGEKFSVQLRPNVLYQLRETRPKDQYAWTNRLLSFSADVGLYYRFGR